MLKNTKNSWLWCLLILQNITQIAATDCLTSKLPSFLEQPSIIDGNSVVPEDATWLTVAANSDNTVLYLGGWNKHSVTGIP